MFGSVSSRRLHQSTRMHFGLRIVLFVQICIFQCHSEWVKISQTSDGLKNSSHMELENKLKEIDLSAPSPQWIEYQKERFSGTNVSQKLVISGESHLKTSAEIIVPARTNNLNEKRNKIVRTTTKISLEDSDAEEATKHSTETGNVSAFNPEEIEPTSTNTKLDGAVKFPSFTGFLKFLTSLQQSLLTKTSFGITDKIQMLKNIRDQLMLNIEDRFGAIFPKSRQKRGLTDESSFQFPPEAALMSISFLTFSVFLIKLVLQVIHIIKSKHYSYTGMTMNNMSTNAKIGVNARKFGESNEDLETLTKVSAAIKANPFSVK